MIDIHCHILPGTDDGPETIEESLAMCRIAALDGIKVIVATPHFRPGISESSQEKVSDRIAILMDKVKQECIDFRYCQVGGDIYGGDAIILEIMSI